MTSRFDDVVIHQLIGRLVYFHCLFIEPALTHIAAPQVRAVRCCNHRSRAELVTVGQLLPTTAWAVVVDTAESLAVGTRPCPDRSDDCCVTCTVVNAATAIAETWAATEHAAYGRPQPKETILRRWGQVVSQRLATAFAHQYQAPCLAIDELNTASAAQPAPPCVDELPLLSELLDLWTDPALLTHHPVAKWLNHCTDLEDIRKVSQTWRVAR